MLAIFLSWSWIVSIKARLLALEWSEHGVTINAIAPTFIYTPGTAERLDNPDYLAGVLSRIPANKVGAIADVAEAVLLVDGGWTAQ